MGNVCKDRNADLGKRASRHMYLRRTLALVLLLTFSLLSLIVYYMDIDIIYDQHSYYIRYAISDNALHTYLHIWYFDTRFICSLILTYIYTYIYTYVLTYIYTYIHTYIYLHTYILTYIHIQCISSPDHFVRLTT